MREKGIAIAGSIIADVAYTIDTYPAKGNLTYAWDPKPHTGGTPNMMIDLSLMDPDLPITAAGMVGEDANGDFILDTLHQYPNIETSHILREGRTAVTYAMTEQVSKERTFFFDPGTSKEFNETHIDFDTIKADLFHLEYLLLLGALDEPDPEYGTRAVRVLNEARKRGMETSVDMVSEEGDRYRKVVPPCLPYTDYLIINEVEAGGVTGIPMTDGDGILEENIEKGLRKLHDMGVGKWVVIHAPACGYGLDCESGRIEKVKSYALPDGFIKGTTGAGDAFCAGVLYAAFKEKGLQEGLRLGALTAACSLSEEDNNSGVRSLAEMEKIGRAFS